MWWTGILCMLCVAQKVLLQDVIIPNKEIKQEKNIDEVQNDFLFNYHKLRETTQKRKRKRNVILELPNAYGVSNKLESRYAVLQNEYPISESNEKRFLSVFEQPLVTEDVRLRSTQRTKGEVNLVEGNNLGEIHPNDLMNVEIDSDLRRNPNVATCDMEQLMTYLAEMQAINPESIVNLASEQDLDALCDKAVNSLDNIDTYLRSCSPPTQQDLYLLLIKGVRSLSDKVCFDRSFRSEFMKQAPCISQLHNEYLDCVGPTDWVEDPNVTVICQTYKNIGECYFAKTLAGCGPTGADTMRSLLVSVMDSVIPVKCDKSDIVTKRKTPPMTKEPTSSGRETKQLVVSNTSKQLVRVANSVAHLIIIALIIVIVTL